VSATAVVTIENSLSAPRIVFLRVFVSCRDTRRSASPSANRAFPKYGNDLWGGVPGAVRNVCSFDGKGTRYCVASLAPHLHLEGWGIQRLH